MQHAGGLWRSTCTATRRIDDDIEERVDGVNDGKTDIDESSWMIHEESSDERTDAFVRELPSFSTSDEELPGFSDWRMNVISERMDPHPYG